MMAIVIGVFLLANTFALRCGYILLIKTGKTCDDEEYKIPLLILNSAINPIAYAFFKRDIKKEMTKVFSASSRQSNSAFSTNSRNSQNWFLSFH